MCGGGSDDVESTFEPWEGVQPYASDVLGEAQGLYNEFRPTYFPYQTVAPRSSYYDQYIQALGQQGMAGSPGLDVAQQAAYDVAGGGYFGGSPSQQFLQSVQAGGLANPALAQAGRDVATAAAPLAGSDVLGATAGGEYLGSNPYLDATYEQAARGLTNQYLREDLPGVASYYSGAGRYGSGAMNTALDTAEENYLQALGDLGTSIYGGAYETERGRQQAAAETLGSQGLSQLGAQQAATGLLGTIAGGDIANRMAAAGELGGLYGADIDRMLQAGQNVIPLAEQQYRDISALGLAGQEEEAYGQRLLDDLISRMDYYQTGAGSEPAALGQYASYVSPYFGGGYGTQTEQVYSNDLAAGLGAASSIAGMTLPFLL